MRTKKLSWRKHSKRGKLCIQETHWVDGDAELWLLGLLGGCAFHSSSAPGDGQDPRQTRRAGRLGGVVTILATGFRFAEHGCHVLVPGHAILAKIIDLQDVTHEVIDY